MSKQRQIIIIFNQPIDERNISRFNLKKIDKISKNFHIVNFHKKSKAKNKFINSRLLKINIKSIIKLIFNNEKGCYIDLSNRSIGEIIFLRFLSILGYKRITLDVGLIPIQNTRFHILKNNLNNNEYLKFFFNIITRLIYKVFYKFILPKVDLAFTSGTKGKFLSKQGGAKKIIEAHNLDYDNFLNIKKIKKKNYAVYIDQDLSNNEDLKNDGVKFDIRKFEKKIDFFLNHLNSTTIKIQVAGSNRRKLKKNLFKLNTKYFNTDRMIAECKFVMGHNSTALQYAILFKKPILLITTKEIKKVNQIYKHIINFKNITGCEYLSIDNMKQNKNFSIKKLNNKKYEFYVRKYIKSKHSINKNFFEILKNNL